MELGKSVGKAFTFNPYDIPFALIYFCTTEFGTSSLYPGSSLNNSSNRNTGSTGEIPHRPSQQSARSGSTTGTDKTDPAVWIYHLQDTVGIPEGHILAPQTIEIHRETFGIGTETEKPQDEVHIWPFRRMAEQQTPINVSELSPELLEGISHQGWPELPTNAIAVPILGARDYVGKDSMMGMLILGINPRREFDETYQTFANMCGRQIAASMTMVKTIEEEALKAEELAAINRDRTNFFNSVSHELRTPLTLILGPLDECLDDSSLSQQHKGRLDMVRRNARRLLRLVNSLLDFSRVEAGKMRASFRETNLQKYTADLASLFRSAVEKGGVRYVVDTSGKGKSAWVDRDMWEVPPLISNILI
jgi:signal transduction histidine kinase